MQTSELRPCPCCEGKAKYYDDIMVYGHMVYCTNCGLRVTGYNSKKEAMEAWNNRPDSWHTGTPTEEGWYLVAFNLKEEKVRYECWYYPNKVLWDNPYFRVIGWMPIPPYEEKEE